jgi:hypothetical protein
MSVSKYRPHVLVLPEDGANRQLANGFLLHDSVKLRSIQVLPEAGGWSEVRSLFQREHAPEMTLNPLRHMVLLLDFDGRQGRLADIQGAIPEILADRVFVIGLWTEPEDLFSHGLPGKEEFGRALANECFENRRELWNHALLRHNADELDRMTVSLRPILFP